MISTPPEKKSLGRLIRRFQAQPMGKLWVWTFLLPGVLSVLIPLYYGYSRAHYATLYYGPVAAEQWSRPWYALAILALLIFSYVAILRMRAAHRYIAVYERGVQFSFGRQKTLHWEEIAGLATEMSRYHFFGRPLRLAFRGIIYPNIHKPIRLTQTIEDLPELLTLIKARLYPRLLPNLESNLEKGQSLHFGPLSIRKDGLILIHKGPASQRQTIPWENLRSVDVVSGFLVVELSDYSHRKLPVSKIPNIELLLQLIQQGVNT